MPALLHAPALSTSWDVPKNRRLVSPSIRVATDSMISSWQRDLSLSHRGFNVERIWVVVHFNGVEPDLGRKDYPPEIVELLNLLEDPVADDVAKQSDPFLIPTSTSGREIDYEAPNLKAQSRLANPFPINSEAVRLSYLSEPMEEQDVVALFNELRGEGLLSQFEPVFFSGSYVYDSYLRYNPAAVSERIEAVLPGNTAALPNRLREGVAEFKFRAHDLLPNIVRELKQWSEIRWLVCWTAATTSRTQGGLTMHVSEVAEGDDAYAGVTHIATLDAAGEAVIHVVALKTLLQKLGAWPVM
ncbi:hypothetical protein [Georgenia sp. SUBG003]|uniref:hypothetical protein n=1 Tax=Georgenia sp. SUBG003 TaxID=1497974 RepID=UPI003AB53F35